MHEEGPTPAVFSDEIKTEPMSLPVAGRMRKGVFYEDTDDKLFLFVNEETGALLCYRVKIGENNIRATTDIFCIPAQVLSLLWPDRVFAGKST